MAHNMSNVQWLGELLNHVVSVVSRGLPFHHLSFNPKKIGETLNHRSGLATWQSLGLILSMLTVGANMVDPVSPFPQSNQRH